MRRDEMQSMAIPAIDISKRGVADANGFLQHRCEHWFKIAGGAADDLKNLRCGRLLFQRLSEIGGALTQFIEQSRVLDGDDGLSGKVPHQFDLLFAEELYFLAENTDRANEAVFFEHRHNQQRAPPAISANAICEASLSR